MQPVEPVYFFLGHLSVLYVKPVYPVQAVRLCFFFKTAGQAGTRGYKGLQGGTEYWVLIGNKFSGSRMEQI